MDTPVIILLGAIASIMIWVIWMFNRLVALNTRAENAWSDVDVQLKRRWDLVPELVVTVRGYARHEATTLEAAIQARSRAETASGVGDRGEAEAQLGRSAGQLIALVERYPTLEADELFGSLHDQLVEVEGALQSARRYYNALVRDLNTAIRVFPSSLVARMTRFAPREFFQIDDAETGVPNVGKG